MKIYSYYDNINFDSQKQLISLWKRSWEKQGFTPIVLSADDAKQHPYYEEFVKKIRLIHKEITDKDLTDYGLSCYLRWLAYANQNETECFLMSDYDVINKNFTTDDLPIESDQMHFLDRYCPCLVYGNSQGCLKFCKDIVEHSTKFKTTIIEEYQKQKCVWYHDQEFLALNYKLLDYIILTGYVDLYKYGIVVGKEQLKSKLFHVAHRSIGEAKSRFPELKNINSDKLRVIFVNKILNNTTCELTLGLDIPSCFDAEKYESVYPETQNYHGQNIEKNQRLYHHYLQFGKKEGVAFNHNSLPVFYHVPKCGGISIYYNSIIYNLYYQYCILSNSNNTIYDISILHNNLHLLNIVAKPVSDTLSKKLEITKTIENSEYPHKQIKHTEIVYNDENISFLLSEFDILGIMVQPDGFINSDNYINSVSSNKNINKIIVLRKPINQIQSLFYYLRDVGHWEPTSQAHQNMSFSDYVDSALISDSWIIRNIVGLSQDKPITEDEYIACQTYLNTFKHIGFLEDIQSTINFFKNEYNWLLYDTTKQNENKVSKKEAASEELLNRLDSIIHYDNKLYNHFFEIHQNKIKEAHNG